MKAIYKRELRSYFTSMTGYIFIAVILAFTGIYFMAVNMYGGYPYFSQALANTLPVFMFAIPVLTMRSFADERRSKTDQLLLTAPVSLTQIVMGKYLAMVTVFAIPVVICIGCCLTYVYMIMTSLPDIIYMISFIIRRKKKPNIFMILGIIFEFFFVLDLLGSIFVHKAFKEMKE